MDRESVDPFEKGKRLIAAIREEFEELCQEDSLRGEEARAAKHRLEESKKALRKELTLTREKLDRRARSAA